MQSCCFLFSRPFHENFKFLKNCPSDFHEILHSHSTLKGAPAFAKASKSYGWDVRNIAKIGPKIGQKTVIFQFSQKLSVSCERNFLQSFYTIIWSFMSNFNNFNAGECEKYSQNLPKMARKLPIFDVLKNCLYDSNKIFYSHFLHHSVVLCFQIQ